MEAGQSVDDLTPDGASLEAFSDGVFAIAITLLVLEIRVPPAEALTTPAGLIQALGALWPSYLGYALSFVDGRDHVGQPPQPDPARRDRQPRAHPGQPRPAPGGGVRPVPRGAPGGDPWD